ncbi:MAG: hypothetical protein JWM86_2985 [Thermoleophilia bacterium]|jgi:type II secretory pathway pseudopilin PulG|nr:hypothetical protein [Thermoleophilia bacterium]
MKMPARDESVGSSLIEVLISIAIIGVCFGGLLGAMGTSVVASGVNREQADAHAVLVSAAEAVKDDSRNPFTCTTADYNPLSGVMLPTDWMTAGASGSVRLGTATDTPAAAPQTGYWDGVGFHPTTCSSATDLQRITLIATSPGKRATERLTIFKRRP